MTFSKEGLKKQLTILGFEPLNGKQNIYIRDLVYKDKIVDTVTVDFNAKNSGKIDWGTPKDVGRQTSSDLSKPEFMIQLYWYIRLAESGYSTKNIAIEQPVQLGHKDGFIDIVVFTDDGTPFMALDAKTSGTEDKKYIADLKNSKGQVASYYRFSSNLKYVGILSAKIADDGITPVSYIVSTDPWKKSGSPEEYLRSIGSHAELPNIFKIAPDIPPYSKKSYLLKPVDLIDLNEDTASQMFHDFLTILRKHGISDKTNAFNKVLNLFIAKIVDEFNTPDDSVLSFQNYVGENETPEALYAKIENLYSQGLRDFIKIYIDTDKEMESIKRTLNLDLKDPSNQTEVVNQIEHLLSKTNSDFQFKDVYDERTYKDNLNILKELVDLIAPYKLKYAKKQQFLGDFFENILSNGFKQESGQFFTPVPLAHFMISALPLSKKSKAIIEDDTSRQPLPRMIDFACGSGHFITEYMDRMQKIIEKMDLSHLSKKNQQVFKQFKTNPFEWSQNFVYGLDIDYRLVKTSKVSSFLNGDGDAIIRRANGLDSFNSMDYTQLLHSENTDMMNQVFDVLVANPPYHVDEFKSELPNLENDFELGKLVTNNSSEIEALFVERASQLLKPNGLLAIILPSAILDTENSIYVEARKLLLKRFKVVSIMKNPNKATFAATKVETVTIFAKRRDDNNVLQIQEQIKQALNTNPVNDITVERIENYIGKYIKQVFGKDFDLQDYSDLLNGEYSGANIVANNYLKESKRKKNNIPFSEYVKEQEVESILLHALTENKSVIIQTPTNSMKEALQLLGYKFSGRRGHEGLHSRLKNYSIEDLTLLYGKKDKYLDYLVRNAFDNKFDDSDMKDDLKPFYRIGNLNELIDFKAKSKSYKLMLSKALVGNITDYGEENTIPLHKVAILENGTAINAEQIQPGNIPVIAGGREPAYYNDRENRTKPTITISQSGAYAGFIAYHEEPIFASDCFTITAKPDSEYSTLELYYLLKQKQEQVYSFATGSIQKHVYASDMEDFNIPDKSQDSKNVDELISNFKSEAQRQQKLESELSQLQKDLTQDIDRVYKGNQVATQDFSNLEDKSIVKVMGGKRVPKEYDFAPFQTKHYYPGVKEFENFSINLNESKYIDDAVFDKIKRYVLEPDDVFISAAGTIGKVGMAPQNKDVTISLTENAHRIRILDSSKLDPRFVMYILSGNNIQTSMKELTTKTGTPKLSIESLRTISIPILPIEKQKALISKWDDINKKIQNIYSQIK